MRPRKAYEWLVEHHRINARYDSIRELLGWDQRTHLPKGGQANRAAQITTLAGLISGRKTDPKIGDMLGDVEGSSLVRNKLSDEAVNVREWRRAYDRAKKIPEWLAVQIARISSECEMAWQSARQANDWQSFMPHLGSLVELKREEAGRLTTTGTAYDSLIKQFEPGETAESLAAIFSKMVKPLIDLTNEIRESPFQPDPEILQGYSPIWKQKELIRQITGRVGYDLDSGQIDRSSHPFTSAIGPGDVRITTRYRADSFAEALFSAIHESGHALYEQGLPPEHWGTPRGTAVSMAIHESQSLMWENMIARSTGFWKMFYPSLQTHFPWLESIPRDSFHFAVNRVQPGLIRTEADEVTYNLHVILRFELEKALIGREIEVEDLPHAWNEKMKKYLLIKPPDYAQGVMQDVHWAAGAFGYFPSYALGTVYAAQFYAKAAKDIGDPESFFEAGHFGPFLAWFRGKIYSQGSRYLPRALVKTVTGEELNPRHLIDYLDKKYGMLYALC